MGTCVGRSESGRTQDHTKTSAIHANAFKKVELELLSLMYANLAKRSRNNLVTRETFDLFFHSSGLVGEILFLKFDANKSGAISFSEFLSAFELMIKGSLRQRADILFEIYDVNNTGGVKYEELLKILFSYNIEELNKMFIEPKFLEYVGPNQLSYYFGAQHMKIELKNILVEDDSSPQTKKKQIAVPQSVVLYKVTNTQTTTKNVPKPEKQSDLRKEDLKKKFNFKSTTEAKDRNHVTSTLISHASNKRKNMKIQSNVASLTKKYANYLYSSAGLNKEKDVFSKENFFHLIQEHPTLFNAYLTGFHTYIWQADSEDEPQYFKAMPWIESEAIERFHDDQNEVFLKFIQKTVFVMKSKKKKMPLEIISLEGLTVDFLEENKKEKIQYGITFKHRDGLYDAKEYFFAEKSIYDEWCKHLTDFRSTTVEDLYIKYEKIGGGNFSSVYRGKDKKNGQEVAIKIIETFKLSLAEKEVLKRETGILKQCHHPNIINFLGQFKTKTHIFIVTEILSEGDLFEYTKKNSFLEQYEAAIIIKQLVDAIIYLNEELGIIHRDLKPENVLIKMTEDKKMVLRVKLIDFGFGVFKDKIKDLSIKEKFAGTPGFIAPEIYNTEDYDDKVDTFSIGIILFFILSGKFPFHSPFLQEIESLTKSCSISLENNHWSNVSDQAKDLLTKILCFKQKRITTRQVAEHPWLGNIEKLKKYIGRNPKNVKGYLE